MSLHNTIEHTVLEQMGVGRHAYCWPTDTYSRSTCQSSRSLIASLQELRYRGSRDGRLRPTHSRCAAAQPIPKVNNDVEIPNLKLIPAIVGNRAATKRCRVFASLHLENIVQSIAHTHTEQLKHPGSVIVISPECR